MTYLTEGHLYEVVRLIARYRSITVKEAEFTRNSFPQGEVLKRLTGFGATDSCTLCRSAGVSSGGRAFCENCIHSTDESMFLIPPFCTGGASEKTYNKIISARNGEEIVAAFRERADYLEMRLTKYKQERNIP